MATPNLECLQEGKKICQACSSEQRTACLQAKDDELGTGKKTLREIGEEILIRIKNNTLSNVGDRTGLEDR